MLKTIDFINKLNSKLTKDDVVITDAGTSFFMTHYIKVKQGMRIITSGGFASMGYGIPAGIGSYLTLKRRTIVITGDGSFTQALPELQTLAHYKLPLKVFVLSNGGYLTIRLSQEKWFKKKIGEGIENGVSIPSIKKIVKAFGIKYTTNMNKALKCSTSIICEIKLPKDRL